MMVDFWRRKIHNELISLCAVEVDFSSIICVVFDEMRRKSFFDEKKNKTILAQMRMWLIERVRWAQPLDR